MSAGTGAELKSLFLELLALEPAARALRLSALGQGDPALRDTLEALLAADARADARLARLDSSDPPAVALAPPDSPAPPAPPAPPDLAGQTLGHFRVLEMLGAGGMGVVYRAQDVRLSREVALKLLPPHLGLDSVARSHFLREARAAAGLDHPNVATVFEVGEAEDGRLFHATALYRGETLRQRLERGPLRPAEALDIATQVLRGLAHAHAAGVVHRDLKPENLIITPDGVVKIVDFGLATLPGTATWAPPHAGTAGYMAPEQLRGGMGDPRSDLWALGVVLHEMLAGRRPFQDESALGLAARMLDEAPLPLPSLGPDVPPRLAQVAERLLQREPDARPVSAEAVLEALGANIAAEAGRVAHRPRRRPLAFLERHRWLVLAAVVAVALGGYGAYARLRLAAARAAVRSIAVLPFDNLTPESASQYVGDGIAEQVLDELGRIDGVRVVARTSSFAFRGRNPDAHRIGRDLHVASVLEGSVAAAGDRIRVSVQLVGTGDGYVIWSERYDRPRADILTLQDDIAGAIATALAARLRPPARARARGTPSMAAYELYVDGRNLWYERTPEALVRAGQVFERVVALDSTYALAYAGLADVYAMMGSFEYAVSPPAEAYERARVAAHKALLLDPELGPAHAALANVAMNYDRDWAGAEREFRRALALNPGYAPAHQWYAFLLVSEGRNREALAHVEAAGELDPWSPLMATVRAQYFYFVRDYPRARRALDAALRLDPRFARASLVQAQVDMQTGRLPAAIARLSQLRAAAPDDPVVAAVLGYAYGRAGERARAAALRACLSGRARQRYVPPELPAMVDVGLGDRDRALAGIEQAFRERSGGVLYLPLDPLLDPLRSDPRFQDLLRKLHR